jgi:DNA ligase-1
MYNLYKLNKNSKEQFVTIELFSDDAVFVKTTKGFVDGKSSSTVKAFTNSKNKTAAENGMAFMLRENSRFGKSGYSESRAFKDNYLRFQSNNSLKPMLLNKVKNVDRFTDKKLLRMLHNNTGFYIQPKLDGFRCQGFSDRLQTRDGNVFVINHIMNEVKQLCEHFNILDTAFLDGELYNHTMFLNEISSAVQNQDLEKKLKFHIYDFGIAEIEYSQRLGILTNFFNNMNFQYLTLHKIDWACNTTEMDMIYQKYLTEGYEGAVIKNPKGFYEFGYRSNNFLKLKPLETEEFLCVGGHSKTKQNEITLEFVTEDGKKFSAAIKGNTAFRKKAKREFNEKWLNRKVTVEYRAKKQSGVPAEAVALIPRDYE